MKRILTIFILSFAATIQGFAQKGGSATVSGYIIDESTGETLIGAGALVRSGAKSGTGAVTNVYGYYTLTIPRGKVSLQYSYVGYESQAIELDLRRDTTISIALKPSASGRFLTRGAFQFPPERLLRGAGRIHLPAQ